MDAGGFILAIILDGNLRLGVGPEVGHDLFLAPDSGQFAQEEVREFEGEGHVVIGLVAGIPEDDALVAGPLFHGIFADDPAVYIR